MSSIPFTVAEDWKGPSGENLASTQNATARALAEKKAFRAQTDEERSQILVKADLKYENFTSFYLVFVLIFIVLGIAELISIDACQNGQHQRKLWS